MEFNSEEFWKDRNQSKQENNEPTAWRVEDDVNLNEGDLKRDLFITDADKKPVREGSGEGGQNFGKNNNTPAGNDKNNPSQNAGNTNAYLDRTEPSEEHPENSNFKVKNQDGEPDYSKAQPNSIITNEEPKPEKVERGDGENDRPHKGNTYYEGTDDKDEEANVPGPDELPEQQKVGEDVDDDTFEKDHIET
ncbi:MAG: hypothetical protein JWQ84_3430 [Mucilaginibacter sp.]|nr:hypothetical protein [Mucilaginibacter sp.]